MKVLKKLFYRISNAFLLFLWALKNPDTLKESNFKMLSELLGLIMKVAIEDRHMMTHIGFVHPDVGEQQIVSIWAGAGLGAEPTRRIADLISENAILKEKLASKI